MFSRKWQRRDVKASDEVPKDKDADATALKTASADAQKLADEHRAEVKELKSQLREQAPKDLAAQQEIKQLRQDAKEDVDRNRKCAEEKDEELKQVKGQLHTSESDLRQSTALNGKLQEEVDKSEASAGNNERSIKAQHDAQISKMQNALDNERNSKDAAEKCAKEATTRISELMAEGRGIEDQLRTSKQEVQALSAEAAVQAEEMAVDVVPPAAVAIAEDENEMSDVPAVAVAEDEMSDVPAVAVAEDEMSDVPAVGFGNGTLAASAFTQPMRAPVNAAPLSQPATVDTTMATAAPIFSALSRPSAQQPGSLPTLAAFPSSSQHTNAAQSAASTTPATRSFVISEVGKQPGSFGIGSTVPAKAAKSIFATTSETSGNQDQHTAGQGIGHLLNGPAPIGSFSRATTQLQPSADRRASAGNRAAKPAVPTSSAAYVNVRPSPYSANPSPVAAAAAAAARGNLTRVPELPKDANSIVICPVFVPMTPPVSNAGPTTAVMAHSAPSYIPSTPRYTATTPVYSPANRPQLPNLPSIPSSLSSVLSTLSSIRPAPQQYATALHSEMMRSVTSNRHDDSDDE